MFEIIENFSLKKYNTFAIDVKSLYFVECSSTKELSDFIKIYRRSKLPLILLGGGSNILFTRDFKGYVLRPAIKGIEIISESDSELVLKVGAGENWDEFVAFCVSRNWGGIENLSLIPGNVGTCPIQNIGAYGVEVKDVISQVESLEIETLEVNHFSNLECKFAYRNSIFKSELKGKHIITHVSFKLTKKTSFNLEYGSIKEELKRFNEINLQNIRQAVMDIRNSKLPNPEEIPNSGSFFKNPTITLSRADELKLKYPEMPIYPFSDSLVKIPAGWLIEKSGWKGKREGDAGVHEKQALVLVNYGNASGNDILHLARNIQQSVIVSFGIALEMEVNVI